VNDHPDGPPPSPLTTILANLPEEVVASFTPEQRAALWQASKPISWQRPPVDIRLSIPLPGRRCFVTLVAGRERRNPARRQRESRLHPLRTFDNVLFLLGTGGSLVLVTVIILLLSNLIDF